MTEVSHKEHEKALKGPDAFQVRVISGLDWLSNHSRFVLLILGPAVVVALSAVGWQYVSRLRKDSRVDELGKVQVLFDEELKKASDERAVIYKKIDEIEKKIADAKVQSKKDSPEAKEELTPDPKLKEEMEALEKKASAIKANHSVSGVKFRQFYQQYQNDPEGWFAALNASKIEADQGKISEARELLEAVLAKSKDQQFYQTQARLSLIGILEQQAEFDKALAEVEVLSKIAPSELGAQVSLKKAQLQFLKKDTEGAKATLKHLIDTYPSSQESQKALSLEMLL